MNKVLVSAICLHYGLNLHLRSPSSTPLHDELQNLQCFRRTRFLQIAKHVFSKSPKTFSPNRRTCFLQIANVFHHMFLQIAEDFSPNLQDILPISEQHTFCSVLYGKDPVSDLSLHVPRALRSALWVVGCGSLVTPVPPTCARASRSTLWTMG